MTLNELLKILKRRWIVPVALMVVFGLAAFAYIQFLAPREYGASGDVIVTSGSFSGVAGLASAAADGVSGDGVSVSVKSSSQNNTITFTGKARSGDEAIAGANDAIKELESRIKQVDSMKIVKSEAAKATLASPGGLKYGLAGAAGGLFAGCLILVGLAMISRRIYGWRSLEEASGLGCLGTYEQAEANRSRLAASIFFAGGGAEGDHLRACIIPAGSTLAARLAVEGLRAPAQAIGMALYEAPSLATGPQAILAARRADSVAIAIEEGVSTFTEVEDLIRELDLAGVVPAGFIYCDSVKGAAAVSRTAAKAGQAGRRAR